MTEPKRKRILIVEDEPDVANLLKRALEADYDVTISSDGPGALALASRLVPDLFLLDVMIPGFDGFGLAGRLHMVPELAKRPIIFVTARTEPEDVVHGIQLGARAYITKPFSLKDVREKVRKALGA